MLRFLSSFMLAFVVAVPVVQAERIKDITSISGVRTNQLVGYGLVVGLDGTGDKAPFTTQTFRNMMAEFGITLPAGVDPKLKNVAAVSVTAELPAFAKPGQRVDVTVASLGNAKSLRGGALMFTPLKGADGNIYAVAQGNLVVGGFGAEGNDGSKITVNIPSVGRIPNGASVEQTVPSNFSRGDSLIFNLDQPDFTTARAMVERINTLLGPGTAEALDATSIRVSAPRDTSQRVSYLSIIENLEIETGKERAKVIINSRTGTIVIGQNVMIEPVAVTHGSLVVTITEDFQVAQPNALAGGETVVVPQTNININNGGDNRMFKFGPGVSLDSIVKAVNEVGAAPGDLMAILEAMKQAGALKAELIVI
ncbi:MAG: flagellar biosynthesis protein FlgI [Thalassobium sp.]|jgi:flagellar P-ring protein precursor FlgI|uniref:Flagellar P-ring protein n=1 Tax=Thalassolituus pacificus TaxID=2975440 RepID=A0A9X2WC85_9GAMM|nr:flagellar basal body P-ring protein FlgI [Thalassolituus pacificus]MCT7357505.1 flagellar basal body P-ring protein FlgI [Thalassolituus pacificus]PHS63170.1 MAG: flagellar biosynthesis protein FlgI [Thalassobium sp.]